MHYYILLNDIKIEIFNKKQVKYTLKLKLLFMLKDNALFSENSSKFNQHTYPFLKFYHIEGIYFIL